MHAVKFASLLTLKKKKAQFTTSLCTPFSTFGKNIKHHHNFRRERQEQSQIIFFDFVKSSSLRQLSPQFPFQAPTL